jgi:hypothetical protein
VARKGSAFRVQVEKGGSDPAVFLNPAPPKPSKPDFSPDIPREMNNPQKPFSPERRLSALAADVVRMESDSDAIR